MNPRVSQDALQGLRRKVLIGMGLLLLCLGPVRAEEGPILEKDLEAAQGRLTVFDQGLTFQERKTLRQASIHDQHRLSGALFKKYKEREALRGDVEEARLMVDLKHRLLSLPGHEAYASEPLKALREKEAEVVARMAVPAFGELRRQYEMVRPAIFHNLLVNMGVKDQGLCWHWARDMMDRLTALNLKTLDVRWASAREGTMREHNTVVLISKGRDLQEGLFLDGWKKAGKPFWMMVRDDKKHPWKPGRYYDGRGTENPKNQ